MYNDAMNRNAILILAVVLLVVIGGFTFTYDRAIAPTNSDTIVPDDVDPVPNPSQEGVGGDRMMDIETYVRLNISELSPEKAVLGGTFYVTEIQASNGRGVVQYEDGHIALVADFTYTTSETSGHTITSFTVRPQ
jgi:hypothetical protein